METKKGKIIVICAPSGSGKSTIINNILDAGDIDMQFSISATNRAPRPGEQHGVHYYFMSTDEFREAISRDEFIEWEQVYPGRYYGTLRSQVIKAADEGHNVILDIDVKGALSVKDIFGDQALTIYQSTVARRPARTPHRPWYRQARSDSTKTGQG